MSHTPSSSSGIAVSLFSGGMDSAVLLYLLRSQQYDVRALSIHYGQKHKVELQYGEKLASIAGIPRRQIDLGPALLPLMGGSCLTDASVPLPLGHYEEESMKKTVVPNRNMILLSLATAYAVSLKASAVAFAAHAGDHAVYPDCRIEFADAMQNAILLCDWHTTALLRPFLRLSKADIVRVGHQLGVPFEYTWSCYRGEGPLHCGACGTCVERREAFALAHVTDPTPYDPQAPQMEILCDKAVLEWSRTIEGERRTPQPNDPLPA